MRLAGARTIEEANTVLKAFLPDYNSRFKVIARQAGSAYRKPAKDFKAEEYFCYKYPRTVGSDNVVRFVNNRLQILPDSDRASYARCKVEVYAGLDGKLAIYHNRIRLNTRPAPLEPNKLREPVAVKTTAAQPPIRPSADHPWRGKSRTFFD